MKNEQLAIAIPTYNRVDILKEDLLYMMEEIKQYNIPIYISDDSTNNQTELMIEELKKEYEFIYYHKNSPSLGHDKNCFATLRLPTEKYIWYLGDSMMIERKAISMVMELIENNEYDFIVVGRDCKNVELSSREFFNAKEVFSELSWHLTLTGVTIYKRKIIEKLKRSSLCKNFPQTSIILNAICEKCNLYYESKAIILLNKKKVSYWNTTIFEVFAKDWANFIYALPDFYTENEKKKVIKSHSMRTGLFSIRAMVGYKILGYFNLKTYIKYYKYINAASHESMILIILVASTPVVILKFLKSIIINLEKYRGYYK